MKLSSVPLLIVAALLLTAAPDAAAKKPEPITGTVDIKTGMTSLVLDEALQAGISGLGTEAAKVKPGQFVKGRQTYRFPIRGGAFDLTTAQGEIIHSGGIKLATETTSVSLTDFIVTLPAPAAEPTEPPAVDPVSGDPLPVEEPAVATLTALVTVNGTLLGRVPLFVLEPGDLAKPHQLPSNKKLTLTDVLLTLTAEGAEALNSAFAVTTFAEGDAAGAATVNATTTKRPL